MIEAMILNAIRSAFPELGDNFRRFPIALEQPTDEKPDPPKWLDGIVVPVGNTGTEFLYIKSQQNNANVRVLYYSFNPETVAPMYRVIYSGTFPQNEGWDIDFFSKILKGWQGFIND